MGCTSSTGLHLLDEEIIEVVEVEVMWRDPQGRLCKSCGFEEPRLSFCSMESEGEKCKDVQLHVQPPTKEIHLQQVARFDRCLKMLEAEKLSGQVHLKRAIHDRKQELPWGQR